MVICREKNQYLASTIKILLCYSEKVIGGWVWWRMSLLPALGKQGQADLYEIWASLVYRSKTGRIHREILSQNNNQLLGKE